MCEVCLSKIGGLDGLHARVIGAELHEAERARLAALCVSHKCPECLRIEENRAVQLAPGKRVSVATARAIEDEWVRDGLIR